MAESQTELEQNRRKQLDRLVQELPKIARVIGAVGEAAYAKGALSTKTKRLMAMAIALGAGCRNCVLAQTRLALELGASKEEILEALGVVISMRGTTGVAESLRVIQLLDEMGRL